MIEPDDATQQRSSTKAQELQEPQEIASTIQIPAQQQNAAATGLPTLPYMQIEDLLSLRIASDPQISPDGAWIAFTVLHCNAETNTTGSSIWLVNSTAGKTQPARQLTSGVHNDTTPRWSPDGQTLAFLSDRTGTAQIYLLPLNGGEPRQASTLMQGVTEYSWHPMGKALLAHSYWKPEDEQKQHTNNEITSLYTRLGAAQDGIGYKHGRHLQLWLIELEGQVQRLTAEPVDLEQSCWSPDGTEIAFCANLRTDADLSASAALWVLTVATGQMRRLSPEDGLAQMPSWSPDGQYIAYLYTPDLTESGNYAPWIVPVQGNEAPKEAVTGAGELTCQAWIIDELRSEWLMRPQWYADSKVLLVAAQERGQVHLARLDRTQNQIIYLTRNNGCYISPQISRDGQTIAVIRADWFTPGDVWSMDNAGKNLHKLTSVNDDILHQRQLIRPQRISWQAPDGLAIEGWLYLPPLPENGKIPLILAPHGGPTLSWGDRYVHEFQVLAGRGYAVLAPNPRGSAGYGEEFGRKMLNDWGGADFQDIIAGLDYTIATAPIDAQRLGIEGMSYGGYMTNWAITQTDRFKAAVSRNGISSLPSATLLSDHAVWFKLCMPDEALQHERSALTLADRITTPLLLLHAEQDLWCPFSESLQLFVALRQRKRLVELICYHNVGHLLDWPQVGSPQQRIDRLRRTVEWFEKFV